MLQDLSFGPVASTFGGSTAAVAGAWHKPRGPLSTWAVHVVTSGSTSTVTAPYVLQGTLDDAASPAAASVFTLSTGAGAGYKTATGKAARQVRVRFTSVSSTSSTAPGVTARICGTL